MINPIPRLLKSVSTVFSTLSERAFYRKYPAIMRAIGMFGEPSYTDKEINELTALNSSVYWACTRVISDPVGFIPLHLHERKNEDERPRAKKHPIYRLLHAAPNPYMPAVVFRQTLQAHALGWAGGFAHIKRASGTGEPLSLWIIPPDKISPIQESYDAPIHYRVSTANGPKNLAFRDVLHIPGLGFDGVAGYSVVSLAKNSLGLDLAAQEFGSKFFARGGRVPFILEHPNKFTSDAEFDTFRARWEKQYSGPEGYNKAPILEGGLKYHQIGFKPEDGQFLGTRKFSVEEICRWFLVYPFEVGDMSRANFSNIEQLTIDRIFHTLNYWLVMWEQQIWLRMLNEKEQEKFFAEFDRNAILQGDFETRIKGYTQAKANGMINADFISARENWPKLPNGAGGAYHVQMNMQTVPGTGEPMALEKAAVARATNTTVPKQTTEPTQ